MRWEDERYVRVYVRDTVDWIALSWQARALFLFILRKVDRAGLLDLGRAGSRGLAVVVGMPHELVAPALDELVADGCVELKNTALIVPNFIEAQESKKTDVLRKQESRLKQRDMVRAGLDPRQRGAVIYFIQSEHGGPIKIGRADDVAKRLVNLQTSRPDKLVVLAACPGTQADERALHEAFGPHRERGEWFAPAPAILEMVRAIASGDVTAVCDPSRFVTGDTSRVTIRDTSHVSRHDSCTVTPCRAVPSHAYPSEISSGRSPPQQHPEETRAGTGLGAAAAASTPKRAVIDPSQGKNAGSPDGPKTRPTVALATYPAEQSSEAQDGGKACQQSVVSGPTENQGSAPPSRPRPVPPPKPTPPEPLPEPYRPTPTATVKAIVGALTDSSKLRQLANEDYAWQVAKHSRDDGHTGPKATKDILAAIREADEQAALLEAGGEPVKSLSAFVAGYIKRGPKPAKTSPQGWGGKPSTVQRDLDPKTLGGWKAYAVDVEAYERELAERERKAEGT